MRIKIVLKSGASFEAAVLGTEIRSGADTPVDSFIGIFPFSSKLKQAKSLFVYSENEIIFSGAVDKTVLIRDAEGLRIELHARSAAARLIDNEATPAIYNYPCAEDIFTLHALPFGIASGIKENLRYHGEFVVHAGENHWQVISRFCRSVFGCEPSISADGALCYFPADVAPEISISDGGRGLSCSEYEVSELRAGAINEIRCRVQREGGYSHIMSNPFAEPSEGGVMSVLDLTNTPLWERRNKTSNFFRRSMEKQTEIKTLIPGETNIKTGQRAVFYCREGGEFKNLYVYRRVHRINENGAYTVLTLRKKVGKFEPDH